jgi:hypothetical protein
MNGRATSYHRIGPEIARPLPNGARLNSVITTFLRAVSARCTRLYGYLRLA